MSGQIIVGPILGFRGAKGGRWYTSALFVTQGEASPPQLTITIGSVSGPEEKAILLKKYADNYVWRLDWSVEQTDSEQQVDYAVNGGNTFRYVVPELNKPLR